MLTRAGWVKRIIESQPYGGRVRSDKAQHASYVSQLSQQLSCVCVQAQSRLLWTDREMERESRAQAVAARQGRNIYRAGDFLLD